jgi:hypothetical protein
MQIAKKDTDKRGLNPRTDVMTNWNVQGIVVEGNRVSIADKIAVALNGIESTKVIREIVLSKLSDGGGDNFLAVILIDA